MVFCMIYTWSNHERLTDLPYDTIMSVAESNDSTVGGIEHTVPQKRLQWPHTGCCFAPSVRHRRRPAQRDNRARLQRDGAFVTMGTKEPFGARRFTLRE